MTDDIYHSMIQPRGREYRSDQIKPWSHYREPIDTTPGRLAGNSRVWGDASPEVQSRVIDELIGASQRAGLSPRETAHVLAIARIESGFNPDAAAGTTSAAGLGQFIDRTGAGLRNHPINNGNRFDARAGADALVEHFIENRDLARSRGQGEEYIYKYHHDGPTRDYGGLGLSNREVMPRLDEYERFVRQRLGQQQTEPAQTTPTGQARTAPTQAQPQTTTGPRSFDEVMRLMLPPQDGVAPHMTSDFGPRVLYGRHDNHGGVDFNYQGGQTGLNLRHPTVRSPVSGTVEFPQNSAYNTVGIRDSNGNLHQILHLDARSVRNGQTVQAGDPIGTMGNTNPNNPRMAQHVHYQIRDPNGRMVDPERFWNNRTIDTPTQPATEPRPQRTDAMRDGLLRQGERGPEVVAAQEALNRLGYTGRNGQPLETRSGIFGPETLHALQDFQRRHGLKPDGVIGDDTRTALATAAQRPLLSEATHPNHALYAAFARQLPAGTRPEAVANVTLQAMENGITSPELIRGVVQRGNDVIVARNGVDPGARIQVDLTAPTATMQQMSDHVRQQSQTPDPAPSTRTPEQTQTSDTEVLRPRTMLA